MKVKVNEDNIRLDKYLSNCTSFSREIITKMINEQKVKVNGALKKGSYKVKINDEIEYDEKYSVDVPIVAQDIPLEIIYEDSDLIIINKPSGMVVHPANAHYTNTLVNALMYYTNKLSDINGKERAGIVHRLDKDTSGLLIVAKNNKAHKALETAFKERKVEKEYIALLNGDLPYQRVNIDAPIKRDNKKYDIMIVSDGGKKALTDIEVIERYDNYTLVKINIKTGRTHQIRVHMKYIGFPIYNDPVYSFGKCTSFGQFLHASKLVFNHPVTNKKMEFKSEMPKEMKEYIKKLKEDKDGNKC